jgi:hypothetical protein
MNTTSIFYSIAENNNLDAAQLDDVVNQAFDKISEKYPQFEMQYEEQGVTVLNFEDCTDEETGGWTKEEVENNLTEELLKEANKIAQNS